MRAFKLTVPYFISSAGAFVPSIKNYHPLFYYQKLDKSTCRQAKSYTVSFSAYRNEEETLPTREIVRATEVLTPLHEVTPILHQIMKGEMSNITIAARGYITHKRSFGSALAFIDLVESDNEEGTPEEPPLQALLKRQAYNHNSTKSAFSSMLKSLHPGSMVYIEGHAASTKNVGEVILLVNQLNFIKASRNPENVKGMLNRFNLDVDPSEVNEIGKVTASGTKSGLAIEEFDQVFGPQINCDVLSQVLLEGVDVEDLVQNGILSSSNTTVAREKNKQSKTGGQVNRKLPYAKIARFFWNNLPPDDKYPSSILAMKGNAKSVNGDQLQYNALPPCPSNIKNVPLKILNACGSNAFDAIMQQSTIRTVEEALDEIATNLITEGRMDQAQVENMIISGWVQNRRRFQGDNSAPSIASLELVDDLMAAENASEKDSPNRLKCILHPDCMNLKLEEGSGPTSIKPSNAYGHLASKGARVSLCGVISRDEITQRPMLWVTKARIERSSWRPAVIRYFLDLISGNSAETGSYQFEVEEIGAALDMGHSEALELIQNCKNNGTTQRQWQAAELSRKLQDESSRMGKVTDDMKKVLEDYSALRTAYPVEHDDSSAQLSKSKLDVIQTRRRNGSSLRKGSEGSRFGSKKKPQVEWMVAQIKGVVESHPAFGLRPLNILDVGGGRGHLANHVASILGKDTVNVHVIDIDSRAVNNGMKDAERKNLEVYYGQGDASNTLNLSSLLQSTDGSGENESSFDVIIALHACGVLTDVALGHAVANHAAFVITPCCFRSNPKLMITVPKKEELESVETIIDVEGQTEALSASTWLGMKEDALLSLTRAAEIQGDIDISGLAIHTLCALRANSVANYFNAIDSKVSATSSEGHLNKIRIKTFPLGLSTRNYCIVGEIR
uniref:Methyltransferase domain-containing protein n=1 Tax=Chaetoceros debilis TaxID=122233 RepID=A0A7S3VG58_9STRA